MIIELTNTSARLADATADDVRWLDQFLTFRVPPKTIATSTGDLEKLDQQPIKLLNRQYDTFPAGMLSKVVDEARRLGRPLEVDDQRRVPGGPRLLETARRRAAELRERVLALPSPLDLDAFARDPEADAARSELVDAWGILPYAHQIETAAKVLERTRCIACLSTAAGKTDIAILLARLYPVRWLMVVPGRDLLEQTAERWERRTGEPAGVIGDGAWNPGPQFTVATIQALDERLKKGDDEATDFIHSIEAIAVDEVHVLTAPTFYWVVQRTKNAYIRVGFSATPLRGGHRDLYPIAATGSIAVRVTPLELHHAGLVAYPRVHALQVAQSGSRVKTWKTAQDTLLWFSAARNIAIAARANAMVMSVPGMGEPPGLVLCPRVQHAEHLQACFAHLGFDVPPLVTGKTRKKAKRELIAGMRSGSVPLVIATDVWRTGLDVPELRTVINAGGGKSEVGVVQGLGRGMRIVRDDTGRVIKDTFDYLDIADLGWSFGERHWQARREAYEAAGYEVTIE